MKIIKEIRIDMNNNESAIKAGVYETKDGYEWITFTRSGTCKKLSTAMKKAALNA